MATRPGCVRPEVGPHSAVPGPGDDMHCESAPRGFPIPTLPPSRVRDPDVISRRRGVVFAENVSTVSFVAAGIKNARLLFH